MKMQTPRRLRISGTFRVPWSAACALSAVTSMRPATNTMEGEALLPQLDEAQKALVGALEEACAVDLSRLDTPELRRIDEKLDAASKAAKEALSLQQRLENQPAPLPHRVFDDDHGKQWHAFAVQSSSAMGGRASLPDAFRNGWLVFDSADEVRRIAPIPEGWLHLPLDELRLLCHRTSGTPKRVSSIEAGQTPASQVRP